MIFDKSFRGQMSDPETLDQLIYNKDKVLSDIKGTKTIKNVTQKRKKTILDKDRA